MENINITFTGITDYLRDKDNEIDFYKSESIKYINRFEELKERINKAIELINKRKEEVDTGIGWVEMRTEEYFEECDETIKILLGSDGEKLIKLLNEV